MRRLAVMLALLAAAWAAGVTLLLVDLVRREAAVFDVAGERRLADLAVEYGRALATGEVPERGRLEEEARFIAERRAFLWSWGTFGGSVTSRWVARYAVASTGLLVLLIVAATLALRRSLRHGLMITSGLRSWTESGRIPPPPRTRDTETLALHAALAQALAEISARERRRIAAASLGEWRSQGRLLVHEIKNRLSPLRLDLDHLRDQTGLPESCATGLERMEANVGRLEDLLVTLRSFSTLPEPELGVVDPALVLRDCAARLDREGRIRVEAAQGQSIRTDARYLDIICTNLITNALESAPISRVVCGWDGRTLTVSDDGPGMEIATRERAFDLGFTTKAGGGGTGLAIVAGLCRIMAMSVSCESEPGKGTTFRLAAEEGA